LFNILNMDTENQSPEIKKMALLEKINRAVAELGSTLEWIKLPEAVPGTEILKDKVIVMVDDMREVLANFVSDLMMATDGKAAFVQYVGQEMEELSRQVLANNPDIVLLDHNLSDRVKGAAAAAALKQAGFGGSIVSFSSEQLSSREYQNVSVLGSVEKNNAHPEKSIKQLADLINQKEE